MPTNNIDNPLLYISYCGEYCNTPIYTFYKLHYDAIKKLLAQLFKYFVRKRNWSPNIGFKGSDKKPDARDPDSRASSQKLFQTQQHKSFEPSILRSIQILALSTKYN
jgi:hypothetical protein